MIRCLNLVYLYHHLGSSARRILYQDELNLIKYTKILQKRINLDLNDYKDYSGRYIIFESKERRKGKEYDNNGRLIYCGEYLDGKKHGTGEEYYNSGYIKFKGKYKNNQRVFGQEFNREEMVFEGEFKKGKRWKGKGKEIIRTEIDYFTKK